MVYNNWIIDHYDHVLKINIELPNKIMVAPRTSPKIASNISCDVANCHGPPAYWEPFFHVF